MPKASGTVLDWVPQKAAQQMQSDAATRLNANARLPPGMPRNAHGRPPTRASIFGRLLEPSQASAADLKFLHRVPRVRRRNFKSKSGTRIIELLVPFGFRSSYSSVPRCITNFENRALVPPI